MKLHNGIVFVSKKALSPLIWTNIKIVTSWDTQNIKTCVILELKTSFKDFMWKGEIFKLICILNFRKRQQCASPNATFVFPIYVQKWNSKQMGFKSLFLHPWDLWKSCVKYHLAARLAAFPAIHRLSSKVLKSSLNESY